MKDTYSVTRDKAKGTVVVKIRDGEISTQKADSLARGMFVPAANVRFTHSFTRKHGTQLVRLYRATNWL